MAMKPEFKKVWVGALRSGEFKQGRLALKGQDGGHCCLGVACVVWKQAELADIAIRPSEVRDRAAFEFSMTGQGEDDWRASYLPDGLGAIVGLNVSNESTLASMNDGGKSFAEIADYIEANL